MHSKFTNTYFTVIFMLFASSISILVHLEVRQFQDRLCSVVLLEHWDKSRTPYIIHNIASALYLMVQASAALAYNVFSLRDAQLYLIQIFYCLWYLFLLCFSSMCSPVFSLLVSFGFSVSLSSISNYSLSCCSVLSTILQVIEAFILKGR